MTEEEVGTELAGRTLSFIVPGLPVPQGSKRAFQTRARIVVVDDNPPKLKLWRSTFIDYAQVAIGEARWQMLEGGVSVGLSFYLPKPASRPQKDHYPDRKPDVDKLARAGLDALTIAGVFQDDAQVCLLTASKAFADEEMAAHTFVTVTGLP